ncbi:MAG TPA: GNAT family N-acetyltransferase [Mycobacteriales bacterium]|nr:GNAT family N-acetyltransferase [Mycobacteriales bacterium]
MPYALAVAVIEDADVAGSLAEMGLRAGAGWPHADTADALRPAAEHGSPGVDAGWLIVEPGPDGPAVVGDCGWRGGPDAEGTVEIGYGLAAPARGRGLGTEAVGLLTAWAEQQPGVRAVVAEVLVGNEASRRLLLRLGFTEEPAAPPYVRCVRLAPGTSPEPRRIAGRHVC